MEAPQQRLQHGKRLRRDRAVGPSRGSVRRIGARALTRTLVLRSSGARPAMANTFFRRMPRRGSEKADGEFSGLRKPQLTKAVVLSVGKSGLPHSVAISRLYQGGYQRVIKAKSKDVLGGKRKRRTPCVAPPARVAERRECDGVGGWAETPEEPAARMIGDERDCKSRPRDARRAIPSLINASVVCRRRRPPTVPHSDAVERS